MGTSLMAEKILSALIEESYNIVAVYTKLDKKTGRKMELGENHVKSIALQEKIPVFQPEKFDDEAVSQLKQLNPDLIIVVAYGKILPKEALEIPGLGCINVHGSLLPKLRGPSPIQNALLAGEKETGITIMLMDERVDTGNILSQEKIKIEDLDTFQTLYQKLISPATRLLLETIPLWVERKIEPKKQNGKEATLCQLIEREDGHIFWNEEAEIIYNKFRAFYPWPGIFSFWKNNDTLLRIKFNEIDIQKQDPQTKHEPGEIFQLGDKIGIQTFKGILIPEKIQLEGKKELPIKEFINGYPDFIGSVLR